METGHGEAHDHPLTDGAHRVRQKALSGKHQRPLDESKGRWCWGPGLPLPSYGRGLAEAAEELLGLVVAGVELQLTLRE